VILPAAAAVLVACTCNPFMIIRFKLVACAPDNVVVITRLPLLKAAEAASPVPKGVIDGNEPVLNCQPVGGVNVIEVPLKSVVAPSWIKMLPIVKYAGEEPPTALEAQIFVPPAAGETVMAATARATLNSINIANATSDLANLLPDRARRVLLRFNI